jgi:putative intracellular protease/amidase
LSGYDAVHVAGGQGATYDLYPNEVVGQALERFWEAGKIVGAICHGAISLGNVPGLASGRHVTGYSLEADRQLEDFFGPAFLLPHYPQVVLEETGTHYSSRGVRRRQPGRTARDPELAAALPVHGRRGHGAVPPSRLDRAGEVGRHAGCPFR